MKHGANIYKYAKKLQCKTNEIIDFSSNINSYHPNITITPTKNMLVKYADTNYSKLKKTISNKYEIKTSQIALYNGATSAIFELVKSLKEKTVYLYAPLYGEYEKACTESNKKIFKINPTSGVILNDGGGLNDHGIGHRGKVAIASPSQDHFIIQGLDKDGHLFGEVFTAQY